MLIKINILTYPVFNDKFKAVEKVAKWFMAL